MSELAATQIPKPSDEAAFERCNEILWRCILNDDSAHLFGRRGQRQHGVDIVGLRNGQADKIVGIQCKLKGDGKTIEETELRAEVTKALTFRPPLSEFIMVTTAPDDAKLQALALELSKSISRGKESGLRVQIIGWTSLEREIRRHPQALKAFDPSHTPHSDRVEQRISNMPNAIRIAIAPELDAFRSELRAINSGKKDIAVHAEYERQIDQYVRFVRDDPNTALALLGGLRDALTSEAYGRTKFRVIANMAACQLELGDEQAAAEGFIEAWDHDPNNPRASTCKAFGLLLQEDWKTLRVFAEMRLLNEPENAGLAACYIHSLIHDESIANPIEHVSGAVRNTEEVEEAHIRWLMERGEPGAWWHAAISAHEAHPDSARLQEMFACALLEQVFDRDMDDRIRSVGEAERSQVHQSIEIYERRWNEVRDRSGHVRADAISVPINLMAAYRLMGESEEAIRIGNEALTRFPGEVEIREHVALAMAESGQTDEALDLISGFPSSPQVTVVRYNGAIANEDWFEILNLTTGCLEALPKTERPLALAIAVVARVEVAAIADRRSILVGEQENFAGHTRASVTLAECARRHSFDDLAKHYFQAAVVALRQGENAFPDRRAVAYEAMAQNNPGSAADALIGQVDLDHDSSELRLLAHALVGDYPIRQRAVRFFNDISSEVRSLPAFQILEGALRASTGLPDDAIQPFAAALEQDPSMENLMYLVNAHMRAGNADAIASLLQADAVDILPGSASSRMDLCGALVDLGYSARALDLAYTTLVENLEEATVVRRFLELVLSRRRYRGGAAPLEPADIVRTGSWVRLTQERGAAFEALVGDSTDRPWGVKCEPSNEFIAKAIGRKEGEHFEHINPVTRATQIWTIEETKPRWLQAFRHLSSVFNQKFPEEHGFASISINEGEIEPALNLARRKSEEDRSRADLYLVKDLPMAFVASDRPGGSIAFAQYIASIGKDVRVCRGTVGEIGNALRLVDQHSRSGAVLDALTAWHIAALEIFDIVGERLGSLVIPASELNCLKALERYYERSADEEEMNIGYQNEQYVRQIITAEQQSERLSLLKSGIKLIEKECVTEPLIVPDGLSDLGDDLVRTPAGESMAPAILAGEDRLLLSEDMMIRELGSRGFCARGVWLQAVVLSALRAGAISLDAYIDVVVHLAAHRHGIVMLDSGVIRSTYERDTSDKLVQIQALCNYIGNEGADPVSHTRIASEFTNAIWEDGAVDSSRARRAVDLVFAALLMRDRGDEAVRWVTKCYRRLSEAPRMYLMDWCKANSIPVGALHSSRRHRRDRGDGAR